MEKYAKLLKGLEMCAGPDCCKDECPYYKKTIGGMTCRARLLLDANIAITNELARNENAETLLEHIKSLDADIDDLEAANNTLRAERDGLRIELETLRQGKTDRPSVGIEGSTAYWCGRADALAEVVSSIVGEASGHE